MSLHDLRYTVRSLRKSPAFTFTTVLCLALGIGATSAIFTVFNAALLKPLPFARADRLVVLYDTQRSADASLREYQVSPGNFGAWQRESEVLAELTAIRAGDFSLSGGGEPVYLRGAAVTANYFSTLGVQPVLGRVFSSDEDRLGEASPVVVISHEFWQRSFGGEASILGRSVLLDDRSVTIVGVMPPGFGFPDGLDQLGPRDVWTPLGLDPERLPERNWHMLFVVGQLRSGVSLDEAQAQMDIVAQRLEREYPETNTGFGVCLKPLRQALVAKEVDSALMMMIVAVGCLLLIACINVASILLARAVNRGNEVAMRIALGAGRGRLLRFVLCESLLLALLGGAGGLLLAQLAVAPLIRLSGLAGPVFTGVAIDLPVLAFTLAVAVVTGLLFGLAPALKLLDTDLRETLLEGSARAGGRRWGRFQSALVIGQVALVFALLVGAGLMARSFRELLDVDPGFDTANLLTLRLPYSSVVYPEQRQKVAFTEQILARVKALPEVESATVTFLLPIDDKEFTAIFSVRGRALGQPNEMLLANDRAVGPDFFETLKLPIIEGRPLRAGDDAESPRVVVVSRHMAEQYWPGQSALGRQVKRGGPDSEQPWLTVVGVVEDVQDLALDAETGSTWYLPYSQDWTPWMRLVVRTASEPIGLLPAIRQVIWSIDPSQPITDVVTAAETVSGSLAKERFNMVLLTVFAALGLTLATLGIYGVVSYSVSQRIGELAVRMALGARFGEIRRMILGQTARITLIGLALGISLSVVFNRLFAHLLFEIEPSDPLTLAAMTVFLTLVVLLATFIPAHRATKIHPAELLKSL